MIAQVSAACGETLHFEGNAYDFGHSIAAIQFSLDQGEHWTDYPTPDINDYQNVRWSFDWTPTEPGFYVLKVRSVNDEGRVSPESAHAEIVVSD